MGGGFNEQGCKDEYVNNVNMNMCRARGKWANEVRNISENKAQMAVDNEPKPPLYSHQ
jgi:hypothetical protein